MAIQRITTQNHQSGGCSTANAGHLSRGQYSQRMGCNELAINLHIHVHRVNRQFLSKHRYFQAAIGSKSNIQINSV